MARPGALVEAVASRLWRVETFGNGTWLRRKAVTVHKPARQ
jgi:hypothetical protein